jgi:hypothetical protein
VNASSATKQRLFQERLLQAGGAQIPQLAAAPLIDGISS